MDDPAFFPRFSHADLALEVIANLEFATLGRSETFFGSQTLFWRPAPRARIAIVLHHDHVSTSRASLLNPHSLA
jgi:hypothetical protein